VWLYRLSRDTRPPYKQVYVADWIMSKQPEGVSVRQWCSSTPNGQTITCSFAVPPQKGNIVIVGYSTYAGTVDKNGQLQLMEVEHLEKKYPKQGEAK
jgi:hypothetical protein